MQKQEITERKKQINGSGRGRGSKSKSKHNRMNVILFNLFKLS